MDSEHLAESAVDAHQLLVSYPVPKEAAFTCPHAGCGKTFAVKNNFLVHTKVNHLLPGSFPCTFERCRLSFGYKHVLQRHIQKIHVEGKRPRSTLAVIKETYGSDCHSSERRRKLVHSSDVEHVQQSSTHELPGAADASTSSDVHVPAAEYVPVSNDAHDNDNPAIIETAPPPPPHHVVEENDGRVLRCTVEGCTKSFKWRSNLKAHINTCHVNPGMFLCSEPGCGARFGYRHVMERHVKSIHIEGKKPRIGTNMKRDSVDLGGIFIRRAPSSRSSGGSSNNARLIAQQQHPGSSSSNIDNAVELSEAYMQNMNNMYTQHQVQQQQQLMLQRQHHHQRHLEQQQRHMQIQSAAQQHQFGGPLAEGAIYISHGAPEHMQHMSPEAMQQFHHHQHQQAQQHYSNLTPAQQYEYMIAQQQLQIQQQLAHSAELDMQQQQQELHYQQQHSDMLHQMDSGRLSHGSTSSEDEYHMEHGARAQVNTVFPGTIVVVQQDDGSVITDIATGTEMQPHRP